jgi:hypothetical protein
MGLRVLFHRVDRALREMTDSLKAIPLAGPVVAK